MLNNNDFSAYPFVFWSPVGPHCGESVTDIFARKTEEINKVGFTLWSFSKLSIDRVNTIRRELGGNHCYVFCVYNKKNRDPAKSGDKTHWANQISPNKLQWLNIPHGVETGHPSIDSDGITSSAYVVKSIKLINDKIVFPADIFLLKQNKWESQCGLGRFGQKFLRYNQNAKERKSKCLMAIMRLEYPYVVWCRKIVD